MPNALWKRITGGTAPEPKKQKRNYPFTAAFYADGFCIGMADGVKTFSDFPKADVLNVIHRNGKTTVVRKME